MTSRWSRLRAAAGLCLALWLGLAGGCAGRWEAPAEVADLHALTQAITPPAPPWRLLPEAQARRTAAYLAAHFACWDDPRPAEGPPDLAEGLAQVFAQPVYGENLLPRDAAWREALEAKAGLAGYPNAGWPGLTLLACDLRLLPTPSPLIRQPGRPDALAFDLLQQSRLPPNLPVWVHHQSRDGAWLLVESSVAWGWLPARAVARMGAAERARWRRATPVAVVAEETAILDREGGFLFLAGLGTLLASDGAGGALAATADAKGRAVLEPARAPKGALAPWPRPLTSAAVAELAGRLLGQPYGWGGQFGQRDCSATLKDLFAPLGLFLPRNSGDQAKAGPALELAGLAADRKEALILERGVPLLSLLWQPGHVMLLAGERQGRALVFHNAWGVRTFGLLAGEGRAMIGQAALTTLRPGAERPDLADPRALLVERVARLVFLAGPEELARD